MRNRNPQPLKFNQCSEAKSRLDFFSAGSYCYWNTESLWRLISFMVFVFCFLFCFFLVILLAAAFLLPARSAVCCQETFQPLRSPKRFLITRSYQNQPIDQATCVKRKKGQIMASPLDFLHQAKQVAPAVYRLGRKGVWDERAMSLDCCSVATIFRSVRQTSASPVTPGNNDLWSVRRLWFQVVFSQLLLRTLFKLSSSKSVGQRTSCNLSSSKTVGVLICLRLTVRKHALIKG